MTEINKAGQPNSLGDIDVPQGEYRSQINALTDAVRQLGGNPEIAPGSTVVNDPLSAPYILYVNSYTGEDTFVTGDYASADDGSFEQKMRRISNQRLECGYTEARPFKTINRAAIEAGIITSRDYLNLGNICGDLVTIVVMSGMNIALNGPGEADTTANFPTWSDKKQPTAEELQSFNDSNSSGIILPRGCSLVSLDLRKTNIRPDYVPPFDQEKADYSNRGAIFRVTGTGYYYGFTFLDKQDYNQSHHLLDCFANAGKVRCDEFYSKILKSFGAVAGISPAYTETRDSETQIVGPAPTPGLQTETTDTVQSASPYIYNTSIRSTYGLCGVFADGSEVTGFKSMVIAQFTGVSLQKDMRCWQQYVGTSWGPIAQADYSDDYINKTPDDVRMDPRYRSIHIRCVNRAIIQEVSVFAIGQGIHHAVESGGELTVTNSNSNFGGCASLAKGFVDYSFQTDKNWNVSRIKVSENIDSLANNFQTYFLGTLTEGTGNNATTITLEEPLNGEANNEPDLLANDGFSLNNYGGTNYIWIENPNGPNYYAPLADVAWETNDPSKIKVTTSFVSSSGDLPPENDPAGPYPPIAGKRIYVRRLRDVRSPRGRRYSLICNNTSTDSRNIVRDYGLQTDVSAANISREISAEEPIIAIGIGTIKPGAGVQRTNEFELRRAAASTNWDSRGEYVQSYHSNYNYYRSGDVVRYENKHWKCLVDHIAPPVLNKEKFDQCLVHTEEDFPSEDYFQNSSPIIIFDKDTDDTGEDPLLGYTNNSFKTDPELKRQYRTSTDYLGLYSFLRSLGFTDGQSHEILLPLPADERERDPDNALDGIPAPAGAATSWDNWQIQFRRPSNIRLFGQAFEWAGYLNYSKALPQYQRDLTPSNKFSYYFTNSFGGRVYVSGFNEEGFGVSAAGLTDLQTGETLSPDGLGSDDRDDNEPKVFNSDVVVNGILTANQIDSAQKSLVKDFRDNSNRVSEGRGMSWIAPMETIVDINSVTSGPFDERNETGTFLGASGKSGYTGASFVTPYFLDTWRAKNRLLGSQQGPVVIYVNPRAIAPELEVPDSTENESTNWNTTGVESLLGNPPTTPGAAVPTLRLAIAYADATISKTTPVQYYLGPGLYVNDIGTLTFQHNVVLVGYSFTDGNQFLTDGAGGGAAPWLGTTSLGRGPGNSGLFPESGLEEAIKNTNNMPIFLTRIYNQSVNANTQNRIIFSPLRLIFTQNSKLQGIMWWGATETMRAAQGTDEESPSLIPNSFYSQDLTASDLQSIKGESNDKIINATCYRLVAGKGNIDYMYTETCIITRGQLTTSDVAITAPGFPYTRAGNGSDHPVISCSNNAVIALSGFSLIGNNYMDNTGYSGFSGTAPKFAGQNNYNHFGFCSTFISNEPTSSNSTTSFNFCRYGTRIVDGPSDYNYNLTQINIHLITGNYKYMPSTDTDAGGTATDVLGDNGPAFDSILGAAVLSRRVLRYSFNEYRAGGDNKKSGIAGNFGRCMRRVGSNQSGFRMVTLSSSNSNTSKQTGISEADGDPNQEIPTGSIWEYDLRGIFFKKNATRIPSVPNFSAPQPQIMQNKYTYGPDNCQVNVKYATLKAGLDWEENFQSNKNLLG